MPLRSLKPSRFNVLGIKKSLVKAASLRARKNKRLLESTAENFETVKPTFQSTVEEVDGKLEIKTGPVDNQDGQIWSFLNNGTEVRFVKMTDGFVSKTSPGTFETGPGEGKFRNFNMEDPASGIEPRGWTDLLVEEEAPSFQRNIQKAINRIASRFFRRK